MTNLEKAQEACSNLKWALQCLVQEGASEEAMRPYRKNLREEKSKLQKLQGRT